MDESEQDALERERNDSYNTFYQNPIQYNERENAVVRNNYQYNQNITRSKTR